MAAYTLLCNKDDPSFITMDFPKLYKINFNILLASFFYFFFFVVNLIEKQNNFWVNSRADKEGWEYAQLATHSSTKQTAIEKTYLPIHANTHVITQVPLKIYSSIAINRVENNQIQMNNLEIYHTSTQMEKVILFKGIVQEYKGMCTRQIIGADWTWFPH